ncbi:MAG TPA: prepilin-type N-terminal cleavage/methylation domain-containing protein [Armatimonadota bacterium]|nr:prepilin-type N-terminal cleavage/methylation domain-containing protein [Armatimonadota bacterium]HQK93015.1 prepilin-type N-terminal cleavage/methylation domain-containing protein [Armatimonadota bacterium]
MRRRKGFTLIEMMIVILVIAVLATLVGVSVRNARERSRQATLTAQLNIMHNAIMYYQNDMSSWPPDLSALTSTTNSDPNYHGPYLERVPPHPYHGTWTYDSSTGRVTP